MSVTSGPVVTAHEHEPPTGTNKDVFCWNPGHQRQSPDCFSTRAALEKESMDPQILGPKVKDPDKQVNIALITGLVLGSPEFQKR